MSPGSPAIPFADNAATVTTAMFDKVSFVKVSFVKVSFDNVWFDNASFTPGP
jgi:hypothetical protein